MDNHAPRGCRLTANATTEVSADIFPPRAIDPDLVEAGRRLFSREAHFVAGAFAAPALPSDALPEIALAGRSNVGKSSLLNALTGRRTLARTSNTPGRTRQINFFSLDGRLMLVDLPGYGYAKAPKIEVKRWTALLRHYLRTRAVLRRVCLLIDSRHGIKQIDNPLMLMLDEAGVSYQIVLTKIDKLGPGQLAPIVEQTAAELATHPAAHPEIHLTSAVEGRGIVELRMMLGSFAFSAAPPSLVKAPSRYDRMLTSLGSVMKPLLPSVSPNPDPVVKAAVLAEALPYMRRYAGRTLVIKYGGHAMSDPTVGDWFARDVVLLKQVGINPIVVHGGGPQIAQMLQRLGIRSTIVDGLRVTDAATMEVVEMVLAGTINKQLVSAINAEGGCAIGLCGKDGSLIQARKMVLTRVEADTKTEIDLGFVGEPQQIAAHVLDTFKQSDIIPVIAPIGVGSGGETYNINADTVAGAVAAAVKAKRLLLLTDVAGVLDADKRLISEITTASALQLIAEGVISGGMIPKVETCLQAVDGGVEAAVILDGRVPHAILLELFTDTSGAGTLIRAG